MLWKKCVISLTVFSIMFIGAWYENNIHKRVFNDSPLQTNEIFLQNSLIMTNTQLEQASFPPFKSREYIRITKQPLY